MKGRVEAAEGLLEAPPKIVVLLGGGVPQRWRKVAWKGEREMENSGIPPKNVEDVTE